MEVTDVADAAGTMIGDEQFLFPTFPAGLHCTKTECYHKVNAGYTAKPNKRSLNDLRDKV